MFPRLVIVRDGTVFGTQRERAASANPARLRKDEAVPNPYYDTSVNNVTIEPAERAACVLRAGDSDIQIFGGQEERIAAGKQPQIGLCLAFEILEQFHARRDMEEAEPKQHTGLPEAA